MARLDRANARRLHAGSMTRGLRREARFAAVATLLACAGAFGSSDPNQGWIEVRSAHFVVASNAGEKEARRIADQFEQIRSLFHAAFANLRVDPAQPVLILAAKNENTMKMLLPEDWEVKGHVHPAGLYEQGEDKHYVILRLDSSGDNPFHALYHEYTHALLHLNFTGLPLWLDEGLAEFYGNSRLGEKESRVGTIDETHLYILGQNKLLPIETLLSVEQSSPYYSEANRASVFYAESWALVHYLMLDPEAQQRQLLKTFISAWDKGGNQIEAAQQAFGELKRFGQVIQAYSRQASFRVGLFKNAQQAADKNYSARSLTPGEVLALRADCATHRDRFEQAQPLLEQATQLEPNLAMAHAALGYYLYRKEDKSGADKEMKKAMELGSTDFAMPYYHGMLVLWGGLATPEALQEAIKSFGKATQINPQFAPAFEGLAQAYSASPETQKQALEAGFRAVKLEPTTHAYAINLIYLLLNANRDADARQLAQRLVEKASSPQESQTARELLERVKEHEQWVAERKAESDAAANPTTTTAMANAPAVAQTKTASSTAIPLDTSTLMAVEGFVRGIDCSHKPAITVTLSGGNRPLIFHAADFGTVGVTGASQDIPGLDSCEKWKGRRIRLWFRKVQGKGYLGEITDLAFM
jgi:tetratricopeptide (TPR) repeat protein